jgi:molecular chaperone DnaK
MSGITGFIAIDLGTTNSSVARWNGRAPEVIPVDGEPLMPSVITILPEGKEGPDGERFLRGQDAIDAADKDRSLREFTLRHIKRHRAEVWQDDEARESMFVLGCDDQGNPLPGNPMHYRGPDGHTYSPVEIEASFIGKLRDAAEEKLKRKVNALILTVPASATPAQRKAAEQAAREAGFEHVELLDESTAAALAYGYSKRSKKRNVIAVVDVGGGTTDVTILEVGGDYVGVLGTSGSGITGGSDATKRLGTWSLEKWSRQHPESDLSADDTAMSLIFSEAEDAKKRLSRKRLTEFRIDNIDKSSDGVDLHMQGKEYEIDRETLEMLVRDLIDRMEQACHAAIAEVRRRDPKFTVKDLHDVVLVGGGTRMPAVQAMAERVFGQAPKTDIDPEVAVVLGAAIQAAISEGLLSDITVSDILPHAIRIETHDKVMGVATILFDKGTPYPSKDVLKPPPLSNREAGQTRMPVRIVIGNSDRATECEVAHSFDFETEPGPPRSQRIILEIALNAKGQPFGICGGETFGSAA